MSARLIPFGKYAMQAVGPDLFYYSSGDSWEITGLGPTGELQRLIRLSREPIAVRSQDLEDRIQEEIDALSDPNQAPEIRAAYEEMPITDVMPAMASLHADKLGYLWVERYGKAGEEGSTYDILDPEGRLVGRVALPSGLDILEVGQDYLLGLFRDELEVEYLRLHSLHRPPS